MFRFGGATIHGAHDLLPSGVTQCVCHARMTVTAFQCQRQFAIDFVELCTVRDQIANALRCFADDQFHDRLITQSFPGSHCICHVI